MNQFGPSALINLSNFSSIKPEPASTPPQGSMANSTTVVKIPGTPGTGGRLSPENNQVPLSFLLYSPSLSFGPVICTGVDITGVLSLY